MIGRKNFQIKPWICFIIISLVITSAAGIFCMGCEQDKAPTKIDLEDRFTEMELQNLKPEQDKNGLKFSFDLRGSPIEDSRQYLPFLSYLKKQTGYQFELHFITEAGKLIDDLGAGRVHLAAVGANTFLQARAKYGAIPLVRGVNPLGKAEYQSLIFVAPDSSVRRVEDLRGKSFAFGAVYSTQGHLIPRISLFKHGLTLKDLADFKYTGSHQNCAEAVISGRFDAGGMQDTLGRELAEAGLIRIIYTSKYYPSRRCSTSGPGAGIKPAFIIGERRKCPTVLLRPKWMTIVS